MSGKKVLIDGHRGNLDFVPENTMDSFRSAVGLGVDAVETDIHLSSDNALVLIHDHTVDRTTDGTGLVREKTLEELEALNAGTAEHPAKIPTLREFLKYCAGVPELIVILEVKVYKNDEGAEKVAYAVDETVKLCEELGLCGRVIFNSFDAYVLEYLYKTYGKRFRIEGFYPFSVMENVTVDPAEYIDSACYWAKGEEAKRICSELKEMGAEPWVSNVDEDGFFEAVALGCTMVTHNDPAKAMRWRERL